jgi:hypothetical protein
MPTARFPTWRIGRNPVSACTTYATPESLARDALAAAVGAPPQHVNLKYLAPKAGSSPTVLAVDCGDPRSVADQTESDCLFVIQDVAICVEVKGRTIADAAHQGDHARLRTEIDDTFGSGASQARRLETLIRTNGGIWLETGRWLGLSHIKETPDVDPIRAVSTADLLMESRLAAGPEGNQNLTINLNHMALRVETDGAVGRVLARDLVAEKERTFRGRFVVLSGGTIESAKLALACGLDMGGRGGTGLTDHPVYYAHFAIPGCRRTRATAIPARRSRSTRPPRTTRTRTRWWSNWARSSIRGATSTRRSSPSTSAARESTLCARSYSCSTHP